MIKRSMWKYWIVRSKTKQVNHTGINFKESTKRILCNFTSFSTFWKPTNTLYWQKYVYSYSYETFILLQNDPLYNLCLLEHDVSFSSPGWSYIILVPDFCHMELDAAANTECTKLIGDIYFSVGYFVNNEIKMATFGFSDKVHQ